MVAGPLREVAVCAGHRLVCDGWRYFDQRTGDARHKLRFVGYFETDTKARDAWLDLLGVSR